MSPTKPAARSGQAANPNRVQAEIERFLEGFPADIWRFTRRNKSRFTSPLSETGCAAVQTDLKERHHAFELLCQRNRPALFARFPELWPLGHGHREGGCVCEFAGVVLERSLR